MPQCPADGCDYTGGEHSVAGHYSGKRDDKHSGGYERAIMKMENETKPDETKSNSDGSESAENGDNSGSNGENSDTVGEGLGIPDSEGGGSGGDLPESCPDCGGDLHELPEGTAFRLDNGQSGLTDEGDAACVDCEALVTADGEVYH